MWVKISDDLYARRPNPDPSEVVSIKDLEKEIEELRAEMEIVPTIEKSDKYPDDVNQAIDYYLSVFSRGKTDRLIELEALKIELLAGE